MGKIYIAPESIKEPDLNMPSDKYWKACDKYLEDVRKFAKAHGKCPEAGEIIQFPVGDGAAVYVVYTMKPVQLIHIATGDAWQYQYAHRLTASDIRNEIRRGKALQDLFKKTK